MWASASSRPSTTRAEMMASSYSVSQSSSEAGFTRVSIFCTASSPRTSQPASISISTSGFRFAGGAADAGTAHLGIEHDLLRHFEIGGPIDINVVDAFEMREHRHAGFRLDAG